LCRQPIIRSLNVVERAISKTQAEKEAKQGSEWFGTQIASVFVFLSAIQISQAVAPKR
jgi:hypothetical protein